MAKPLEVSIMKKLQPLEHWEDHIHGAVTLCSQVIAEQLNTLEANCEV